MLGHGHLSSRTSSCSAAGPTSARARCSKAATPPCFPRARIRRSPSIPSRRPTAAARNGGGGLPQGEAALFAGHLLSVGLLQRRRTTRSIPSSNNRQKQVVGLIRTQFLKRFESSAHAFSRPATACCSSCWPLRERIAQPTPRNVSLRRWKTRNKDLIGYVHERQLEFLGDERTKRPTRTSSPRKCSKPSNALEREEYDVGRNPRTKPYDDLNQVADFLDELRKFEPKHDDKLKALVKLLKTDPVLKQAQGADLHRVRRHGPLPEATNSTRPASTASSRSTAAQRATAATSFAVFATTTAHQRQLAAAGLAETRILISTDVLSEGLNLQDGTRLINYDLHWNDYE